MKIHPKYVHLVKDSKSIMDTSRRLTKLTEKLASKLDKEEREAFGFAVVQATELLCEAREKCDQHEKYSAFVKGLENGTIEIDNDPDDFSDENVVNDDVEAISNTV